MNGHSTAQLGGFTCLQLRINRVVDYHRRRRCRRLCSVPVLNRLGNTDWRQQFIFTSHCFTTQALFPADAVKSDQPFFAFSRFRIWNTSWMMLLLLSGDKAISSEAAATTIQNAG